MKLSLFGLYRDVGFDLGTSTTLISFDRNSVSLCEPSVVALEKGTNRVLAVGNDADEMIGRTPDNILANVLSRTASWLILQMLQR